MTTFITRLDPPHDATGPRLAVKDLIDVAGVPTTYGCKALVDDGLGAVAALADAACLAGARAAGARIVGKTNLHELAYGAVGSNVWFGNPVNPSCLAIWSSFCSASRRARISALNSAVRTPISSLRDTGNSASSL